MEVLVGIAVAILLFVVGLRIRAGTITIADFTGAPDRPRRDRRPGAAARRQLRHRAAGRGGARPRLHALRRREHHPRRPRHARRARSARSASRTCTSPIPTATSRSRASTCAIEPGQRVAFVGRSGAGKSTVFNLLPRLYDPTAGRILIDGHDIRALTLASLRDQIAVVSQDSVLLSGHRRARTSASAAAAPPAPRSRPPPAPPPPTASSARCPSGYDTPVAPTAGQFSGGERQRLSIARAILRDAPILLLDEPTSALDAESEALIRGALDRLARGRTTLVIAHRLVDGARQRPDRGHGPRPHRRAGHPRRAPRAGRASTPTSTSSSSPGA